MVLEDIAVVFFIFKRREKSVEIIKRIAQVKPKKIYIIADAGRTPEENEEAQACRKAVEQVIDWDCTITKDYAETNEGCYERIGLGALKVFEKERCAIFLEDDNLPEETFFQYCQEMLNRYESNEEVLWVCGTNYLEKYEPRNGADYVFTHHMLPCGWASWADKFIKYYDKDFSLLTKKSLTTIKKGYTNKKMFRRDCRNWMKELESRKTNGRFFSWDYQMCFSIRLHNKLGIVPKYNQIRNIGVDLYSEHGGKSFDSVMTRRFCGMSSLPLDFPLKHPERICVDEKFEDLTAKIVIPPVQIFKTIFDNAYLGLRKLFKVPEGKSLCDVFRQ